MTASNKQSLVSIIMNCFNCETYLKEAIDSVYAQTYDNWEIIFWDNASTDRSAEIAHSYDEKLKYFRGEETIPLYAARNKALEQCNGEFIAFLDCDDLWMPSKLEKQISLFNDANIGLVYCDFESFNQKGKRKNYSSRKIFYQGYCFEELLSDYFLGILTVVIRRNALLNQKNWFYQEFKMVGDAELFMRLAYSWKIDYVDEVLAQWRVHAASTTWSKYELLASESKIMLNLFDEHIPDLNTKFKKALSQKQAWIDRVNVIALWMKGEGKRARSLIWHSEHKNIILIALYFLSFFPAHLLLPLLYKIKGSVVYTN